MKSDRTQALEWWKAMTLQQQHEVVDKWKKTTTTFQEQWSFEMISISSSTIQLIWSEVAKPQS